VIELYDVRTGLPSLADLDRGMVMAPEPGRFRGDNPAGRAWLMQKGLDLMACAHTDSGDQGLVVYDMAVARIDNRRFDPADRREAERAIDAAREHGETAHAGVLSVQKELPVTYAFRTREGSVGVVQIDEAHTQDTPAVFRIRYKLFTR
jgi:hypothetical protein